MNNNCDGSTVVVGNSVDINLKDQTLCKSSEIRSDVVVEEFNAKRIWGQVVNCNGEPIANSLVKLVKVVCDKNGNIMYQGIAHTITNCEGFYQFDICADDTSCYKILVNKATMGMEAIVLNNGGNCDLCNGTGCGGNSAGYNPCCNQGQAVAVNPAPCTCAAQGGCGCQENSCAYGCKKNITNTAICR